MGPYHVSDFTEKINYWLKAKREQAESHLELPTLDSLEAFSRRTLQRMADDENLSIDKSFLDIWVQPRENEAPPYLIMGTYTTDGKQPLVHVQIKLKSLVDEGTGRRVTAVMSLPTVEEGDMPLSGICQTAADVPSESFFERWLAAPIEWRHTHLICPACGAPISVNKEESWYESTSKPYSASCTACSWESEYHYEYKDDLAEKDCFMREVKKYRQFAKKKEEFHQHQKELDTQIRKLARTVEHIGKRHPMLYAYTKYLTEKEAELSGLRKRLENLS